MIVSWNWLKEYVDLPMSVEELTDRLTLTGLNLEGVENVGDEVAIDLEVTSNRPDCLGHFGVAREISVLWQQALKRPSAAPNSTGPAVEEQASVAVECPATLPSIHSARNSRSKNRPESRVACQAAPVGGDRGSQQCGRHLELCHVGVWPAVAYV